MNKAILTPFIILCLLSVSFLMKCEISVKAQATITVPDNYAKIQWAIGNASDGDTIFVRVGTYYEHVVVNKSVSLVGEARDSTIIDGNRTGNVISITANNVSIEGFTVQISGTRPYDCGIFVDHSSGIDISHNTITNNYYGISLSYSGNNVFSCNTISDNCYGIGLYYSGNNVFSFNTMSDNGDGISLSYSGNNVFSCNTISDNCYGIGLYYSGNNVFSCNTILNNYCGMYFDSYSSNNTVYCNNFNNMNHVWSDSKNVWDDGDEGNYWSDYTGRDLDADGIGDTAYVLNVNNKDNYPLMGMFSVFNVTLERETYDVTTICNSIISEFKFEIGPETGNKIIRFNVTGKDSTVGFCRAMIPTELMNDPYIVLVDAEEIVPTLLNVSNETHVYLYFTYIHSSHTITIISSKTLHLYNELLDEHVKLQMDLYNLNATYYALLNNYGLLLGNYSQLLESYCELNSSHQEYLLDYSKNVCNTRNLMYMFAATTALFIITTVYLSKRAHVGKTKIFEDKK